MKSSSKLVAITNNCSKRPCRILHNLPTAVPLIRTVFLPHSSSSSSSHNTTILRSHHNRITGITLPVHRHLRNHSIHRSRFISSLLPSSSSSSSSSNSNRPANKVRSSARLPNQLQVKMISMLHRRKGQILQGVWEGDHKPCMARCREQVEEVEEEAVWCRSLRRAVWIVLLTTGKAISNHRHSNNHKSIQRHINRNRLMAVIHMRNSSNISKVNDHNPHIPRSSHR